MFKWKYRGNLFFFDKPSKKKFFFCAVPGFNKGICFIARIVFN